MFICLPIYLGIYLSICISVYPSRLPSQLHACTTGWFLCPWISSQHLKACYHAMSFSIICHHVGFVGATPRGPASAVCPAASHALWSVGGGDSPCLGLGHVLTPELLVVKAHPNHMIWEWGWIRELFVSEEEVMVADHMQPQVEPCKIINIQMYW